MAKNSEARIRANAKYDKSNTQRFAIKLNKNTDKEIIDKLNSVDNKQGYIKKLIMDDITKNEELD